MGMRGRIILIRHGQSVGNAMRTFTSTHEVPLTDLGREQARRSGEILGEQFAPAHLYSSPYRRALQTAEIIGEVLALPLDIEADVREQNLGELQGRPYESILETPGIRELPRWELRPPGGETLVEVRARAGPVLERIARSHPEEHSVVVCHGGTIFALWAHALGTWEGAKAVRNGALVAIPHDGSAFSEPELISGD